MKIEVSQTEAGMLSIAATLAQDNMTYAESQEAQALRERIVSEAQVPDSWRLIADQPRDREIELTEREMHLLHNEMANGRQWTYSKWTPEIKALFGGMIDDLAKWAEKAKRKEWFDALPKDEREAIRKMGQEDV